MYSQSTDSTLGLGGSDCSGIINDAEDRSGAGFRNLKISPAYGSEKNTGHLVSFPSRAVAEESIWEGDVRH
jgi:hypothetical protein